MPTLTVTPFSTTHRLAALIAVEREAVRTHVDARVKMHGAAGLGREVYEHAAQVDADAFMALLTAQADVDALLADICALVARPEVITAAVSRRPRFLVIPRWWGDATGVETRVPDQRANVGRRSSRPRCRDVLDSLSYPGGGVMPLA